MIACSPLAAPDAHRLPQADLAGVTERTFFHHFADKRERTTCPSPKPRKQVITVTPALRERALTKEASLTQALSLALQRRGLSDR